MLVIKKLAGKIFPKMLGWVPRHWKVLYPFYLAGTLYIKEETRILPGLPSAFDGLRIAYASDIHFGPLMKEEEALSLIKTFAGLQADIYILGGDYGDVLENSIRFFELMPPFSHSKPVYAVLGNHDYGKQGKSLDSLYQAMRGKGIVPLINQVDTLNWKGRRLAICGPDDINAGKPDYTAMAEGSKDSDFVLFIPHSPDHLPAAYKAGFSFHLALCGHTHGGQIVLFGRSLHSSSRYKDRYRSGWYVENGANIMVSEGVGTSILPMRLGTRSEVHLLTLRAKTEG